MMNFENIKLVTFDLGYTLVYNERVEDYLAYLRQKGLDRSKDEVDLAFHLADKMFMRDYPGVFGHAPETYMPWYIGIVNYRLRFRFNLFEQVQFFIEQAQNKPFWKLFPHTKKVLETLKREGYELGLLSNWDKSCRKLLASLGIDDYFDYIYVSSEVGSGKPDAKMFELLLKESGYLPEEVLYVGDNYYDDVIGAGKAGIQTIVLNRFGHKGVEELTDCIIVPSTMEVVSLLQGEQSLEEYIVK